MKESPKTGAAFGEGKHTVEELSSDRFCASGWKGIEPIYVWSGLIGLAVALLLVGVALLMENRTIP
jgi:hypothetical protein